MAITKSKPVPASLDAALVACDVLAEFFTSGFAQHGISSQAAYEISAVLVDIKATLAEGGRRP